MKKAVIRIFLIPLTVTVALTLVNFGLKSLTDQIHLDNRQSKNKPSNKTTEVHILGTVHYETDSIKRYHLYNYLDTISPSVILYEGDSNAVRRVVTRTDYFHSLLNAFKKGKEVEKFVSLKYVKNNPNCTILPYEWELRDKFHHKHKLRKNSSSLLNSVVKLYSENELTPEQSNIIDEFLELNNEYNKIFKTGTFTEINSSITDSVIKQRQHYVYKKIPEIAQDRKELSEYWDFIPFHMSYWDTRNKAMVQNILTQVQHHTNEVIVVLNGYSHRYYLIEELKKYEAEYGFSVVEKT